MNANFTLGKNEIVKLFRFVQKKRVRYKDVQIELVDHLASAIETEMEADNNIVFEDALEKVYKGFGIYGFAKVVKVKEKSTRKMWRRRIWLHFKKFYQVPQLIGTIGTSIFLIQLFSYYPECVNYVIGSVGLFGFLGLISICFFNYKYDNEISNYLFIKSYMGLIGGLIYFVCIVPVQIMDLELFTKLDVTIPMQSVIISILMPLACILTYILLFKIPKEIITEINNRIFLMSGIMQ